MQENTTYNNAKENFITNTQAPRVLIVFTLLMACIYFYLIAFEFPHSNSILFWLLIAGEVFHLWLSVTYLYTVWDTSGTHKKSDAYTPSVDVFLTVAGEPKDIIEETVIAIKAMDYADFHLYILNDGYVAGKDNWQEAEEIAERYGVQCITREEEGGAKAGNINNGLQHTNGELVVIFDADHVPHTDFLKKTVPYFGDRRMGFVQTPQFYKNFNKNYVTLSAWEQQELFFGPICKGKNRLNSATMCGTNMVIRRTALEQVGGMCTTSIAEDFVTGLFMHAKKWKSAYVPEVLAEGLAPEDFLSYNKQQFRWARGALDVLFRHNPLFMRGLTFTQRIQYLSSASFYLSGLVVLMNALLPLVFLYTGLVPLLIPTMTLTLAFIPFIFLTLYTLNRSSNSCYTFTSLAFSLGSFMIHIKAFLASILGIRSSFEITSKRQVKGNFLSLVYPHLAYILAFAVGIIVAIIREGLSASTVTNSAWALIYIAIFTPFIQAALPERKGLSDIELEKKIRLASIINK